MLVRHQRRVLSEIGFLSQVLDHGDGCIVQRYCSLAGGRLQLAHLHITARLRLQAVPAPNLFYATLQTENSPLQVDITVNQAQ